MFKQQMIHAAVVDLWIIALGSDRKSSVVIQKTPVPSGSNSQMFSHFFVFLGGNWTTGDDDCSIGLRGEGEMA